MKVGKRPDWFLVVALAGFLFAAPGCKNGVAGGVSIWEAIEGNDEAAIATYAAAGGELDVRNHDGSTPLWVALIDGRRSSYRALLEHGADPNVLMSGKRLVTHWAASADESWWLQLALEHGADPDLINVGDGTPSEGTPLHFAIGNGEVVETKVALENVRLLVDHGADINRTDRYGCDPLADAAAQNKFKIVLYLLTRGADYARSECSGVSFITNIREKVENKNRWYRREEHREELDAVRAWLEADGMEFEE